MGLITLSVSPIGVVLNGCLGDNLFNIIVEFLKKHALNGLQSPILNKRFEMWSIA